MIALGVGPLKAGLLKFENTRFCFEIETFLEVGGEVTDHQTTQRVEHTHRPVAELTELQRTIQFATARQQKHRAGCSVGRPAEGSRTLQAQAVFFFNQKRGKK